MGMWRKRRFQRYLQKTLGKFVGIGDAFLRNDRADYDKLVSVLEHIELGTLTEDNFSDKLPERWADEITKKSPRNRYDDDAAWLCAVSEIIYEILNSLIMIRDGTTTLSYEMAIDRFADNEQSVNERIDAKINSTLDLLAGLSPPDRLLKRDAVIAIVDAGDRVAGGDVLVVGDRDGGDIAGYLWGEGNLPRRDEGIVGRLEMLGVVQIDIAAAQGSCLVGIEACASSHHWSRELQAL